MKQVRKAGHGRRWLAAGALAVTAAVCSVVALAQPAQAEDATTYTLYPTPQVMTYGEGTITLGDTVDVVVEDGIDADTVARLDEALDLKGITPAEAAVPDADGQVDVLVGIEGSGDVVDKYVDTAGLTIEDGLFEKTDAYLLALTPASEGNDARIVVLGKDTDSAFYGLTTVYQLFQQVEGYEVREFTMSDWADVVSRGFIEGYYGNPWSQEDREDLMRWGGYHKLNVYVYAPKDDLKHRLHWRQKYTDEEIEKIAALAEAGNESKCRFVYALLPFYKPGENGMDGNTEESLGTKVDAKFDLVNNYEADLEVLKARYLQVIDAGVRQIALLADDAWNQGGENYLRLLKDLTTWLKELQKETNEDGSLKYPGLKTTIPYVGAQWTYTGTGESWYQQAPENIQFVLTGNQTFGAVSSSFIGKVQANTGRNPFMWINWPCTDPLPNYLTMGGHNTFLEAGVEPGSVDGIMLNPMQQSQPSKQAIFMVSEYAWNIWETEDHADQVWQDSFSYLENNSPNATEASDALRELSSHMRMSTSGTTSTSSGNPSADYSANVPGQDRPFGFWVNDESKDFGSETDPADAMTAIKEAVEDGSVTAEDIAAARPTYQSIVDAANTYEESHTNDTMWEQISPFIKALRDKAQASLLYLDVIEASNGNNADAASALLAQAEKAYAASTSYTYNQLGTNYEARAGHEYVEPTLNALRTYASDAVAEASTEVDRVSMNVTAGSVESDGSATEGPVRFASDGNENTFWSSDWDGTALDNLWLQIAFDEPTSVSALRYLPRQTTGDITSTGSANGTVTEYKVLYSDNGTDWQEATTGTWPDHADKSWRTAAFDTPVTAKYFRLQAVHTFMADKAELDTSMSCAEIRLVAAPKVDYSSLVQAVANAEALDTSGKTAESVSALEQAIAEARALYVNSNADATQIAAAVSKLNAAIAGLTDEPTIFTVTFVGAQGVENQTVEEGKTATKPEVTTPAGYTFGGWLLNGQEYDFDTPVNSNITLTASWTLNAPTLSLTADEAAPVEGEAVTLTAKAEHPGAGVELTYAWAKDGATIGGETGSTLKVTEGGIYTVTVTATDPDGETATATDDITVTFTAMHEPQPETHTVTVVLGNGEEDLAFEVEDGEKLAEPAAPARDGFEFAGWFTTVDPATGELSDEYDFTTPVKSDLTIYAGWVPETSGEEPGGEEPGTGEQPGGPTTPGPEQPGGTTGGSDGLAQTGDPTSAVAALATVLAGAGALAASRRRR